MKKLLPIVMLLFSMVTFAQVGVNTTTPHPSSMLDITATDKGMLVPRMTAAQKTAITAPANGLLVYQTDAPAGFYYYNGTIWTLLGGATSEMQKFGNIVRNTTDTANDNFVFGSISLDNIAGTNDDKRMFFNKAKGAFRVGIDFGTSWDNANVGDYSFASGINTKADYGSTAMGAYTVASGFYATSFGLDTTASGLSSTAMGDNTTASGLYTTALGRLSSASGNISTAMGNSTAASGDSSTALGRSTVASGANSTAMGRGTVANSFAETTLGSYNTEAITPNASSFVATDRLFTIGNGQFGANSNAITVLKNGNTAIGNINPTEKLEVAGKTKTTNLQVTTATPSVAGQVLTATDVNGNMAWATPATATSEMQRISGVVRNTTDLTNDNFVFGSTSLDNIGGSTDDNRMFFNKAKGAFRVGQSNSTSWDNANVGLNSFASGFASTASGRNSTAMGVVSTASGNGSTSMGFGTTASGVSSTAMGNRTTASGERSTAMGSDTTASGASSTAMGQNTTAQSFLETTLGVLNTDASSPNASAQIATDRLFTIGNGDYISGKSNALTILKNGNTAIGNINPTERLEVDGKTKTTNLQVTAGTPAAGKVLTATDAVGNATWQAPATVGVKFYIVAFGIFPSIGSGNLHGGSGEMTIGTVFMHVANSTVAGNSIPCDGRLLSISSNSALFAIIGTTYGGNGTTDFALPNFTVGSGPVQR